VAPATAASAATPSADDEADDDDDADKPDDKAKPQTPEQKMQARFPQPIRVGDLIGQPLLNGDHETLGYVQRVVRASDGKIKLIVPYRGWLRWAKFLDGYATKPVAVPIEVVGSMGPALSSIDMGADDYAKAMAWVATDARDIPPGDIIRIAIARE
jgi:hypothetical protein